MQKIIFLDLFDVAKALRRRTVFYLNDFVPCTRRRGGTEMTCQNGAENSHKAFS